MPVFHPGATSGYFLASVGFSTSLVESKVKLNCHAGLKSADSGQTGPKILWPDQTGPKLHVLI